VKVSDLKWYAWLLGGAAAGLAISWAIPGAHWWDWCLAILTYSLVQGIASRRHPQPPPEPVDVEYVEIVPPPVSRDQAELLKRTFIR